MASTSRSNTQPTCADQHGPKGRSTTIASPPILTPRTSKVPAQDSDFPTTAPGTRLSHTDDSLKAGERGPTSMDDVHVRERITHLEDERIPERVVHARGAAAHGVIFVTDAFGAQIGHLVGDFNDWSTEATPMELVGELFQVTIPLRPGSSYRYRYLLDGKRWQNDLHADDYMANEFGGHDSVRMV